MIIDIDGFNERLLRRTGSKSTVKAYATAIRKFEEFSKQVYSSSLALTVEQLKSGQLDVYRVLDRFVGWLKSEGDMPASVAAFTTAAKSFLRYHDVEVLNETFRSKVIMPIAEQIPDVPIEREVIRKLLLSDAPLQLRCGIAVMASAGTRIGETMHIRVGDVHFDEDPSASKSGRRTSRRRDRGGSRGRCSSRPRPQTWSSNTSNSTDTARKTGSLDTTPHDSGGRWNDGSRNGGSTRESRAINFTKSTRTSSGSSSSQTLSVRWGRWLPTR